MPKPLKIWLNGCFDILHPGHIALFKFAADLGDYVCVGIDSDERIKYHKGPDRPINNFKDRKVILESIKYINDVIVFSTDEELKSAIKNYSPDIFVIGSDYIDKPIIGQEYAKKIIYFNRIKEYSSSNIIEKIGKNQ